MEFMPWCLLFLSLLAHVGQVLLLEKTKRNVATRKPDLTAQDLLHDLTRRGAAILKVEVLDPANLLLRSPRL